MDLPMGPLFVPDPDHPDGTASVYLKYCWDGATSAAAMAARSRELAGLVADAHAAGWSLLEPIDDGWAHAIAGSAPGPDGDAAAPEAGSLGGLPVWAAPLAFGLVAGLASALSVAMAALMLRRRP